jgi:hypothetical protein
MRTIAIAVALFVAGSELRLSARAEEATAAPAAPAADPWIRGTVDERFALVEKHLRGFDVAMVETGYRYGELYWAARDRSWEYATYQLQKIETAIRNGIERRPKRAASARMIDEPIARVRTAIEQRDGAALDDAFTALTATCNECHVAEKVAFIHVAPPVERHSPVIPAAEVP